MKRPVSIYLVWLCLILALGLSACASKSIPLSQQKEGERYCLRILLIKDPELLDQVGRRLRKGEVFAKVAKEMAQLGPKRAKDHLSCLGAVEMDPGLLKLARELDPGETGGPVPLHDGQAWVLVTTDAYFQQGRKLMEAKRWQEAEEALQRDLKLNPDNHISWHLIGMSRAQRGDNQGAVEAFRQGLAWSPHNPALLNDMGGVLLDLGQDQEAIKYYRQARAKLPHNPLVANNLAWALFKAQGDLAEAEKLALEATELSPADATFWDTLGHIQQARGNYAQAVVSLHRALRLGKHDQVTVKPLTESLAKLDPVVVARLVGPGALQPMPAKAGKPHAPASLGSQAEARSLFAPAGQESLLRRRDEPGPRPPAPAPAAQPAPQPKAAAAQAEPRPKPAAVPTASKPARRYHIFLQAASYRRMDLAQEDVARLKKKKLAVFLEQARLKGKGLWYRVLIGPYYSKREVIKLGKHLVKKRSIRDYTVVVRRVR